MCSKGFLVFTLKLPIQTLLSVAPTRSVFWRATQFQQNEHTPENGFRPNLCIWVCVTIDVMLNFNSDVDENVDIKCEQSIRASVYSLSQKNQSIHVSIVAT